MLINQEPTAISMAPNFLMLRQQVEFVSLRDPTGRVVAFCVEQMPRGDIEKVLTQRRWRNVIIDDTE